MRCFYCAPAGAATRPLRRRTSSAPELGGLRRQHPQTKNGGAYSPFTPVITLYASARPAPTPHRAPERPALAAIRFHSNPISRPSRGRHATGRKHWSRDLPLRLKLLQHNAVCSIVERRSHYNVSQGPLPAKRKSLEGMGAAILAKV
jgi:hypothetical protein